MRPKDLTKLTAAEHQHSIDFLCGLSLPELRDQQDSIVGQKRLVYDRYESTNDPVIRKQMDQAMANLLVRKDHLIEAILKKTE